MILLTGLFLVIAGCSGGNQNDPPQARGESVMNQPPPAPAVPQFKGSRAFDFLLRQTSFGPRNPGSRGHADCLAYLAATLRELAPEVRLQEFTHAGYDKTTLRLTNVIASFRPELTPRIILCAHWDTRPRAEHDPDPKKRDLPILGANDGASGVAVLLEIATAFKAAPPPVGVDILLFDGEDYGIEGDHANYFLGARHYASLLTPEKKPEFGILLDMVGDRFLEIPREGFSVRYAPRIVDLVWNTARNLGIGQFVADIGGEVMDDHLPLNEAGVPTIDLIDFDYPDPTNRFWHTHQDVPENCDAQSLEAVGTVLLHVIYERKP